MFPVVYDLQAIVLAISRIDYVTHPNPIGVQDKFYYVLMRSDTN